MALMVEGEAENSCGYQNEWLSVAQNSRLKNPR
jgi:hypothetical protein